MDLVFWGKVVLESGGRVWNGERGLLAGLGHLLSTVDACILKGFEWGWAWLQDWDDVKGKYGCQT